MTRLGGNRCCVKIEHGQGHEVGKKLVGNSVLTSMIPEAGVDDAFGVIGPASLSLQAWMADAGRWQVAIWPRQGGLLVALADHVES